MFDEETGNQITNTETKHIKESLTDPDSACFHKGEKEKCFAYSHHIFTDKNGFVIAKKTVPGNVHDSVSFFDVYNILNEKFKDKIKNVCLDAAYFTPAICRAIILNKQKALMPYVRPRTKKGFFKKYEYAYDEYYDCYICPNNEVLNYSTTDRKGYKHYKSNTDKCENCPLRNQCTESKNLQKTITRHVWEEHKEETAENRYTQEWKDNYPFRKETVERTFGDCKEQHGLRFTRIRRLTKNEHNSTIIFACHNLKKMALWIDKYPKDNPNNKEKILENSILSQILIKILKIKRQIEVFTIEYTYLSTI